MISYACILLAMLSQPENCLDVYGRACQNLKKAENASDVDTSVSDSDVR